jgi:hypothetical protein
MHCRRVVFGRAGSACGGIGWWYRVVTAALMVDGSSERSCWRFG